MKIAIVRRAKNSSFSMEVYADGLISGLRQVRPDWSIVEIQPSFAEYQGSALKRVGTYYGRYWSFPRQVQQCQEVDLVHIIDHSDGHILHLLKGQPRPAVITCHDLINYRQPENITDQASIPLLSNTLWRYAVRGISRADHIITVSDHTAKDVMALFNVAPQRLTTAHNGVDPDFRPLPLEQVEKVRQQQGIAPAAFVLLNVGSNHPRKNVFAVFKALNLLSQQGRTVHFIKAGADFTPEQKAFIQKERLCDRVTYAGRPDKAQLVNLYNAADVLVAPSLYEGFGITPLEAMACGTPVIASNTTAMPEAVGDAGLLITPHDVEGIANCAARIADDSNLRRQLIEKGLARVQQMTWNHSAEIVANTYEQLLQKGKK
jgi:glycosyltransferase involved in cell wall biosynthesis